MPWYEWDAHLLKHFKAVKGMRKMQHFEFSTRRTGVVVFKQSVKEKGKELLLLKIREEAVSDPGLPQFAHQLVSLQIGPGTFSRTYSNMHLVHSKISYALACLT